MADSDRYKNRWYGKYRAFVRDNNDPERLGRVRMEIPAVLGTGREHWSEWAYPCFPYGGNPDMGMFLVPDEGASVWAEFEGGIVQHPIWTGVWLAGSNPGEQPIESQALCAAPICLDCEDALEHSGGSDGKEHAKYHGHPPFYCPRIRTLIKTETGHTIAASDQDAREWLTITDRAGQSLHFDGAIDAARQTGNALARGTRTAEAGDHLALQQALVGLHGRVVLTDASRQELLFDAWQDKERVVLTSNDVTRMRWQRVSIDTTLGRERVHLQGLNGLQEILIDSTAGLEKILIRDKLGQLVVLDAVLGSITVRDVSGSFVVMVAGNITTQSVAHTNVVAGGNIHAVAGGAIVAKAPLITLN